MSDVAGFLELIRSVLSDGAVFEVRINTLTLNPETPSNFL